MFIDEIELAFILNSTQLLLYDSMIDVNWYFDGQAVEKVSTIESKIQKVFNNLQRGRVKLAAIRLSTVRVLDPKLAEKSLITTGLRLENEILQLSQATIALLQVQIVTASICSIEGGVSIPLIWKVVEYDPLIGKALKTLTVQLMTVELQFIPQLDCELRQVIEEFVIIVLFYGSRMQDLLNATFTILVDGSSDREVKEMVRLSSLLTKPSTKDALHANKTLGCSCTTLVVAPDDEKSLPMIPINEAVKTAGQGFFILFSTILTLLTQVELLNRQGKTRLLFWINIEAEGVKVPVLVWMVIDVKIVWLSSCGLQSAGNCTIIFELAGTADVFHGAELKLPYCVRVMVMLQVTRFLIWQLLRLTLNYLNSQSGVKVKNT